MGKCRFCGRDAGLLRRAHGDCAKRYADGKALIISLVSRDGMIRDADFESLKQKIASVAFRRFVREKELPALYVAAWNQAVRRAVERRQFTGSIEHRLRKLAKEFAVERSNKGARGAWGEFARGRSRAKAKVAKERKAEQRDAEQKRKQEIQQKQAIRKKAIQMKRNSGKHQIKELITRHGSRKNIDKSLASNIDHTAEITHLTSRMVGDTVFAGWEEVVNATQPVQSSGSRDRENLILLATALNITQRRLKNSKALKQFDKELEEKAAAEQIRNLIQSGKHQINEMIIRHGSGTGIDKSIAMKIDHIAEKSNLTCDMRDEFVFASWEEVVIVTQSKASAGSRDRDNLIHFAKSLNIAQSSIKNSKALRKFDEKIINDIEIGLQLESNLSVEETPFNLYKSERLVCVFKNALYLKEQVVQRRNQSRRYGSPTIYGMKSVDRGMMGVTTKHIYFVGDKERFRIRYDRIVAFKEYPDGVGLNRGAEKTRHQKFVTGEGWFTYNLVTTLAKLY